MHLFKLKRGAHTATDMDLAVVKKHNLHLKQMPPCGWRDASMLSGTYGFEVSFPVVVRDKAKWHIEGRHSAGRILQTSDSIILLQERGTLLSDTPKILYECLRYQKDIPVRDFQGAKVYHNMLGVRLNEHTTVEITARKGVAILYVESETVALTAAEFRVYALAALRCIHGDMTC